MENYDITNAQKRIIYTEMLYSEPRISNEGGVYIIEGTFNLVKLVESIVSVLNSSEVFRTRFYQNNGSEISQAYLSHKFGISDVPVFFDKKEFDLYKENSLNSKLDIFNDYLFKFGVYHNETGGQLFVLFHHTIADAYSIGLIAKDIFDGYMGKKQPVFPSYDSYIEDERKYLVSSRDYEADKLYWEERLGEEGYEFESSPNNPQADNYYLSVCNEDKAKWENFLEENNLNENIFIITLLNLYQYKLSGKARGVLGIPYYNRRNKKFSHTYGMFASTVSFAYKISEGMTINDLYRANKRNFVNDIKHSSYPYNVLINDLKANGKNLFKWNFNYYVGNMNYLLDSIPISVKESTPRYLPFPANIIYRRFKNQDNEIEVVYNTEIYSKKEIKHLVVNFISFVKNIINESVHEKINDVGVVDKEFIKSILAEERSHLDGFDIDNSPKLFERFQRVVRACNDESAIIIGEEKVSYAELDELVRYKSQELGRIEFPNKRVAIIAYRELDTFVSILALVKLKITYVLIDPEYPEGRQKYILEDSNCSHYINHGQIVPNLSFNAKQVKPEDDVSLYILYTSGTTGKPKGVLIPENGIMRLLDDPNILKLIEKIDTFLQINSLGFDISELEIWGALLNGKALEIIPKAYLFETERLSKTLSDERRFGAILSFTLLEQLFDAEPNLFKNFSFIITGGEQVRKKLIEKIYQVNTNLKIINGYGPTENSVLSTYYTIPQNYSEELVSIGKSLNGSSAYIVDIAGKICSPYQAGEIVVGGFGLTFGYLNRNQLNGNKFYFSKLNSGEKLYHTGDIGFYDSKGNIFIKGRDDSQVKINGQRIEIQEIEKAIQELTRGQFGNIVVSVIDETIVCFYTNSNVDINELKSKLEKILTITMIPKFFIKISALPVSINGKLDYNCLVTTFEQWKTITSIQKNKKVTVRRNDGLEKLLKGSVDYGKSFIENGGDSLVAMKFINFFSKQGKTIQLKNLLSSRPLAEVLETATEKENVLEIEKYTGTTQKASMIQQEIFYDEKFNHSKFKYNSPIIFKVNKRMLELDSFLDDLEIFLNAQRLLRSHFVMQDGEICLQVGEERIVVQKVHSENIFNPSLIKGFLTEFNVEQKLFNVQYIEMINEDLLVFDFHHSIFDGTSRKIFTDLLKNFISNKVTQSQKLDYYDYLKSRNMISLKQQENFWKSRVSSFGKLDSENLKLSGSDKSDFFEIELTKEKKKRILDIPKNNSLTISNLLLSVFLETKRKYCNNNVNTVGITLTTRDDARLDDIIGPFFNVVPLTLSYEEADGIRGNIEKIGKTINELTENSIYPFSKIDSLYKAFCGVNASSLINWMFVFNHDDEISFNYKGMSFKEVKINDTVQAKYALSLITKLGSDGELLIGVEYNQRYYDRAEIEKIAFMFNSNLDETIESLKL
ncbi:condensation domain-containing protein [Lactococcus lactis]|uniref:condensation domain-containing protein n=1 Tax=Lactococcus lactis TaxID=1358 RepID=UPI00117B2768|nr:condensation domain-containing protein [Lactococcus lactis]TRW68979.1 AMP-binding protein [Lactococcus lactis]